VTVADIPTMYEDAFGGEPLLCTVVPKLLDTELDIWTVGQWPIRVPRHVPRTVPSLPQVIREVRERTGWSARRLAEVAGSTHTTIISAENGRAVTSGHSGDLRQRLVDLHAVVERVFLLVERDSEATATILSTAPATGRSAVDELRSTGDAGRAYIAALDVLRPHRSGLLVGDRPRRDGPTTALHE